MAVTIPGYGTFDPTLPSWLELRADGGLYNRNASDPNRRWVPPTGYRGDAYITFTPEGVQFPPPEPTPEPAPEPTPEPAPPSVDPTPERLRAFYTALDTLAQAEQEYAEEVTRSRSLLLAKEAALTSMRKDVTVALQDVLAQLMLNAK
jgi:hypothetical protein